MQFPLNFPPGAATYTPATPAGSSAVTPGPGATYSNFGYLLLGESLDALAPGGYIGYLATHILSPANWVPLSDWGPAASPQASRNPREPAYVSAEGPLQSVFDYTQPVDLLPAAYGGGYHIETMLAHGGLFASAQAMLRFGSLYSAAYQSQGAGPTRSNTIGQRVPATGFPAGSDAWHTGSLPGTSTILRQIGNTASPDDDVVIYIAFNERDESPAVADWASQAANEVVAALMGATWPAETGDGFWVTLGAEDATAGHGGYHSRYRGFQSALNRVTDGSFLRLQAGSQSWTGTLSKQVRLDAPEGAVTLGP